MAGAGVKTEAHGLSHEQVIGGMQPYGGADHAEGHSAEYPDDIDQAKAEMEIARDATMALQFLEQVRSEFRAEDDDRGYAEFCRVVHTGQLHELETLLRRFPDLFDAALQLTPYAWGHVREGTHADNAMGYIRRVAEQCPQDIYSEFLAAIRGAVTGIPVEDVYMRIAQLFSMLPHTKARLALLHEFFVCHMPQEARDNVIALRREQFPALDLLAAAAAEQETKRE
eukprot:m.139290 g.139290  ORF g.139290 m.139290 type:complete len:226 (-) comp14015_c0_seq2:1573-2250(-)